MLTDVVTQAYPYLFAGTTLVALLLPLMMAVRDARLRKRQRLAWATVARRQALIPFGARRPQFAQPARRAA